MITCQQCKEFRNKGFRNCTGAERIAVAKHLRSCTACDEEVIRLGHAAMERLKPTPEQLAIMDEEIVETLIKDHADPENR